MVVGFLGQWVAGGGPGAWATGIGAVATIYITILSSGRGSKDVTTSDNVFFVAGLASIIPWIITNDPTISIVAAALIDAFAFAPTIRKTLKDPTSETTSLYTISIIRNVLAIAALSTYSIATYFFQVEILLMSLIMVIIILRGKITKNP